jgi:16S rRNA (uracil1498-N3)-methyltransferase
MCSEKSSLDLTPSYFRNGRCSLNETFKLGQQAVTIPRIYCHENLENKNECRLTHDHYKYLKLVLRLKPGDKIQIFDGFGHEFAAVIREFSTDGVGVALGAGIPADKKEICITLAQAIPKAGKMDVIVKAAAELGVDKIIPFAAARSISRLDQEKGSAKAIRWQKIVQEAVRCCRSTQVPIVSPVISFPAMLQQVQGQALRLLFWEEENERTIKDVLTTSAHTDINNFYIIVGPEGGLSIDEVSAARDAGFISVSLGKQILKVETAALAILSIIQYEKGIFSHRNIGG